jgi:hypothetical protein
MDDGPEPHDEKGPQTEHRGVQPCEHGRTTLVDSPQYGVGCPLESLRFPEEDMLLLSDSSQKEEESFLGYCRQYKMGKKGD